MTEHKIGNLFAPLDRIETPEEKAIRVAKGILLAEIDRAGSRLEILEVARQSFVESAKKVDEAMLEAPQEIIESLDLEERKLIDTVLGAGIDHQDPFLSRSEQV